MSSRLLPILVLFFILLTYLYLSLVSVIGDGAVTRSFQIAFAFIIVLSIYSFHKLDRVIQDRSLFRRSGINFHIGFLLSTLITSLIYAGCMLIYDLVRLIQSVFSSSPNPRSINVVFIIALIGLVAFLIMLYGITIGRYHYKIERINLKFNNLPRSFHGFKLAHITDIHAGSYDNNKGLLKGIRLINREDPDIILFTGDIVNDHKDEVIPYIDDLKKLQSKHGTYAVLGNHDYYAAYRQKDKEAYWDDFFKKFKQMKFNLLNNENIEIDNGEAKISIVGSENWGNANWTPKRGDLDRAFQGIPEDRFCILMTHDPSHWDHQVLKYSREVPITLAGHTHGFQFGINLPFLKWSPAKYRYPNWMGLYAQAGQYLYVNRGFGFIAFPGRVGMRPEITVITLEAG